MSAKAIREATGKTLLSNGLASGVAVSARFAVVTPDTNWEELELKQPWLKTEVGAVFVFIYCV